MGKVALVCVSANIIFGTSRFLYRSHGNTEWTGIIIFPSGSSGKAPAFERRNSNAAELA